MANPSSPPYQAFILGLSLYAVLAVALTAFGALSPDALHILNVADWVVCAVFLLDFAITLARAPNRLKYLTGWGLLDLASSIPVVDSLRWARIARIARLLRAIKAARLITSAIREHRAQSAFLTLALVAFLTVVISSIAILAFESGSSGPIQNGPDALWWAFVTVTTVGYGDFVPVTSGGRAVAALLMVVGIGMFGTFSGFVASWFLGSGHSNSPSDKHGGHD